MTLWIADAAPDYQPGLNVPSLAREGYSALIVKATEGKTWRSKPLANQWAQQARDSGLIVGAYHWLTNAPVNDQLDNFLDRIEEFGWPHGMLIALDVESGSSGNPTWDSIQQWVHGWYERTNNHPLMIYTGRWWWNAAGRRWNGCQLTPYLWHSQYVLEPGYKNMAMAGYGSTVYSHVPKSWWNTEYGGWKTATMLQFTSRGTAAGIGANLDLNAFGGTIGDLRALTGNALQPTQGQGNDEMVLIYALTGEAAAAYNEPPNTVWASNGVFRWHIPNPGELSAIQELGNAGAYPIFKGGEVQWLGSHIGHDVSGDTRWVQNTERILTSWARGENPQGIRYSETGSGIELGNPFTTIGAAVQQVLSRPVAEITEEQIMVMAEAIAEHMATSVETVAATGQALMDKLNAALSGAASALTTAMQDQVPRPAAVQWAPAPGGPYAGQQHDGPYKSHLAE